MTQVLLAERALVTGICRFTIHELRYFARGRNEVGGANLPILGYLVMEKSEGQTNTLSGGIFVNGAIEMIRLCEM